MKKVKYIGPVYDMSGYGQACRSNIIALHNSGVELTVHPAYFEENPPNVLNTKHSDIINSLLRKEIDYDTVIIHLTPDSIPFYINQEKGKKIISYTVWETDKLHPIWVASLNQVDEVWVPSDWNVDVFKSSGVKVPVYCVPHIIDCDFFEGERTPMNLGGSPDTFIFYSIFQWNARKNPEGLIRSYYNAFNFTDDVVLVLKCYVGGVSKEQSLEHIKKSILSIKEDMGSISLPRIKLITEHLDLDDIKSLHEAGDCYVTLPHAEGFGLTSFEAGLKGNPVIATGASGNLQYMNHENSFLVSTTNTYVKGMSSFNKWYLGDQKWFEPSLTDASDAMVFVANNYKDSLIKGLRLSKSIKNNFNWRRIGKLMLDRLNNE